MSHCSQSWLHVVMCVLNCHGHLFVFKRVNPWGCIYSLQMMSVVVGVTVVVMVVMIVAMVIVLFCVSMVGGVLVRVVLLWGSDPCPLTLITAQQYKNDRQDEHCERDQQRRDDDHSKLIFSSYAEPVIWITWTNVCVVGCHPGHLCQTAKVSNSVSQEQQPYIVFSSDFHIYLQLGVNSIPSLQSSWFSAGKTKNRHISIKGSQSS